MQVACRGQMFVAWRVNWSYQLVRGCISSVIIFIVKKWRIINTVVKVIGLEYFKLIILTLFSMIKENSYTLILFIFLIKLEIPFNSNQQNK